MLPTPLYPRLNHACRPNAAYRYNKKEIVVIAIAPIQQGAEIVQNYLTDCQIASFEERRARLSTERGFDCKCGLCTSKPRSVDTEAGDRHDVERRRARLRSLMEEITDGLGGDTCPSTDVGEVSRLLALGDEMWDLAARENALYCLAEPLARVIVDCLEGAARSATEFLREETVKWARRAETYAALAEGAEGKGVEQWDLLARSWEKMGTNWEKKLSA